MSRRRNLLIAVLATVILAVIAIVWWNTGEVSVTLADGSRLTCRKVDLASSISSSLRPDSAFARLAQQLPNFLRRFTPAAGSRIAFPDGTNLVFWLKLDQGSVNQWSFTLGDGTSSVLKLDPMIDRQPDGSTRIVLRATAWPRRARNLVLQVFDNKLDSETQLSGELKMPNPHWQKFPEWKPEPLPIAVRLDETEITLERFEIRPHPFMLQRLSRTNVIEYVAFIQFRRANATNAGYSSPWKLNHGSLVDATGNQRLFPPIADLHEEKIQIYGLKIPWPGETVFRLNTWWERRDGASTPGAGMRQLTFTAQPERWTKSVPLPADSPAERPHRP
jgi:hypothetical protein